MNDQNGTSRITSGPDREGACSTRLANAASAILGRQFGNKLETDGKHISAALAYAKAANVYATGGDEELTRWLINSVVNSMRKAQADDSGDNNRLDALVATLRAVDAALPQEVEISDLVQEALSQVGRLRSLRNARDT
jgi:hypothetical protein